MEESWTNISLIALRGRSRLVGALIGLVRATDGAVHVTDDTYSIIIEGLHISDMSLGCSDAATGEMIEKAHADKQTIVPDCSVCCAPCGRTADYDWESVYRAVFALGEDWSVREFESVEHELDGFIR